MKASKKVELKMHGKDVVAKVSANILRLVQPFIAQNDPRYYLNGIHVRPSPEGGTYVEATNGHVCLIARDEDGFAAAPIVISVLKSDMVPARTAEALWLDAEGMAYFVDPFGFPRWASPTNRRIEGNYPSIASVIPPVEELVEGILGAYDPALLASVVNAVNQRGVARYNSLRFFRHRDDKKSMESVLIYTIADKHFGGVMPLRYEIANPLAKLMPAYRALPVAIKPKKPEPAAAEAPQA